MLVSDIDDSVYITRTCEYCQLLFGFNVPYNVSVAINTCSETSFKERFNNSTKYVKDTLFERLNTRTALRDCGVACPHCKRLTLMCENHYFKNGIKQTISEQVKEEFKLSRGGAYIFLAAGILFPFISKFFIEYPVEDSLLYWLIPIVLCTVISVGSYNVSKNIYKRNKILVPVLEKLSDEQFNKVMVAFLINQYNNTINTPPLGFSTRRTGKPGIKVVYKGKEHFFSDFIRNLFETCNSPSSNPSTNQVDKTQVDKTQIDKIDVEIQGLLDKKMKLLEDVRKRIAQKQEEIEEWSRSSDPSSAQMGVGYAEMAIEELEKEEYRLSQEISDIKVGQLRNRRNES